MSIPELAHLMRNSNLPDLMKSIAAQGFFPGEPIMIVQVEGSDEYIVVEGNRRVAACTLLSFPERAPADMQRSAAAIADSAIHRPSAVPSLIFDHATDIHRYLGYRHISGVQEWSPLAKALYLRRQFDALNDGVRTETQRLEIVGDRIGATATYAARLMTSLALYERARERDFFDLDIKVSSVSFSLITLAITRRPINQYLRLRSSKDYGLSSLDEGSLKMLFDWMFVRRDKKTVLGDSRNIGKLAQVLQDESGKAAEILAESRDLDMAWQSTQSDGDNVLDLLDEAILCIQEVREILTDQGRTLAASEMSKAAEIISGAQGLIAIPVTASQDV